MDNAATTKICSSAKKKMLDVFELDYGNPSSRHIKGFDAEKYMIDAREKVAKSLKVDTKEIYFTSGGTESNNMALFGCAMANKRSGNHIITTCFEHPAVYNPLINLEEFGFEVTYIPVDKFGKVNEEKLTKAITDKTIIVSIMYVNNEVGAVQDIGHLSKLIKDKKKDIIFHVDAIQAYGKYKIFPKKLGIDVMSVSGHKIHGPKGSGFIYIKDKTKIKPIIFGGGQEKSMRSGTENVPAIAGLGQAIKEIYTDFDEKIAHLYELKEYMIKKLLTIENVYVNALDYEKKDGEIIINNLKDTAPHIVSVSVEGVKSEVLLHSLEDKKIYVSSGSACSSNHPGISGTLKAIGLKDELLDSTIRFSFCSENTLEEIDYVKECLDELVPVLRKFVRR